MPRGHSFHKQTWRYAGRTLKYKLTLRYEFVRRGQSRNFAATGWPRTSVGAGCLSLEASVASLSKGNLARRRGYPGMAGCLGQASLFRLAVCSWGQ